MTNTRYPNDLAISVQDLADSGWKDVLVNIERKGYPTMWQALSAAAREAIEQGRTEQGKVLWLLADACSMALSPSSPNEPLKPYFVSHDRRSVIPDDFLDSDIGFFTQIAAGVDDVWLRARLCDLVWLRAKPRDTAFALRAIDAYRALPLDAQTWIHGRRECWQRALGLARMLKAGAGDRLTEMEAEIVGAFNAATRADGFFGLWLAELMKSNGLGLVRQNDVAQKLETLACEFDGEGDLHSAREYFSAAADWFKTIFDSAKAAEMTVALAEGWVKEAIARNASQDPSQMAAASFYENAVQIYRTIPRAERATHRVDDRITELRAYLNEAGEKSLEEMKAIHLPSINITQQVEHARNSVTGKTAQQALLAFSNLYPGVDAKQWHTSAAEKISKRFFQSFFGSTMLSRDGRVIAKRPAITPGNGSTGDKETAIRAEMIRDFRILINIVVLGDILPALEILLLEHRLREADFTALARHSPLVPKERAAIFGKALFAGYEGNFVLALHLLIPQIEHMIRVHLKQAGAKTTNIDKDGIQNENGMSTLMDLPEAEQVFGANLTFELKSLFCDAFGPNLRNELAHGLLGEDECNSPPAIYAWWLALRLIFITWWNSVASASNHDDNETQEDAAAVEFPESQ